MGQTPHFAGHHLTQDMQHELTSVLCAQHINHANMAFAGGSEMLMGLCITVTCIVELPIFAANNWILKTLGVNSVIHVTLAVCVIRMVGILAQASIHAKFADCAIAAYVCMGMAVEQQ